MRRLRVLGIAAAMLTVTLIGAAFADGEPGSAGWVFTLKKDFADSEIDVGSKVVATRLIRQAVSQVLSGRLDSAVARVTLTTGGWTSPEMDHSQTATGLTIVPSSVVALSASGEPDGVEQIYDTRGILRRTVPWKDGRKHGEERIFDKVRVVESVAGKDGSLRQITQDKECLVASIAWSDGKMSGPSRSFHPNGKILSESTYVNGKSDGVTRVYAATGQLLQEARMREGQRHGEVKDYWADTGKLKRTALYDMGKVLGLSKEYFADGKLKRELPFKDNAMHGIETLYSADGKVAQRRYWIDGEETSEGEFKSKFRK